MEPEVSEPQQFWNSEPLLRTPPILRSDTVPLGQSPDDGSGDCPLAKNTQLTV